MKNLLLILGILLFTAKTHAQKSINETLSPSGIFDRVYDRFGNDYSLDELRLNKNATTSKSANLCSAGYFDVYFEANSGMEGNSAVEVNRRNVICQLFSDLSDFIVPADPNVKVNIWVRDISSIVPNPSSIGVLGLATGYYTFPVNTPSYSGIIDNEIWKTINSGTNSYTNVTSPLISTDGPNPAFYHGMMAFNFSNPSISWHTDLSQITSGGLYDFYSIALHEITHALGFASLIDSDGNSKLGTNNNYYARYDLFLKTSANQSLITNTGTCSLYNYQFNPALDSTIITPSTSNCTDHIEFSGSVNQAVYSPNTFASGSSLSHFEDICHSPNNYPDNEYYVMSDANSTGIDYMKRYLRSEERNALCDLGYRVNTTYGNASNLNFFNYTGGVCPGVQVAGINDGIDANGAYQHVVPVNGSITLSMNDILQNDFNAVSFECLEDIYGHGTPDVMSGTTFTYTANSSGLALLRYVPVSASNERGNITYIYIYVQDGNCTPSACNIVNNGGMENGLNCTALFNFPNCPNDVQLYCWSQLCGTPDYFVRDCIDTVCYAYPTLVTVPSDLSSPPIETWNNSNSSVVNDKFLGFGSINYSPTTLNESIQVSLQTPLQPNIPYTLKFNSRVAVSSQLYYNNYPGAIAFGGSTNLLAPISYFFNATPATLTPLAEVTIPNNDAWNSFEVTIINTSNSPLNYITMINAGYLNNNPVASRNYTLIDDVSILESNEIGIMNLPDSICINNEISDLSLYLSPAPAGGDFSGVGVVTNGLDYSFDPSLAGMGSHEITYTYETNLGCIRAIYDSITVSAAGQAVSLSPFDPNTICLEGSVVSLPAGSPVGGTYSGNGVIGNDFDPGLAGTGVHEIIYTNSTNSCSLSDTTAITVYDCAGVNEVMNDYGILVYPTISNGLFTVEKPSDLNKEVQISVLDVNSKIILENVIPISEQKVVMDITKHSKGVYFLQFIIDGDVFTKKVIK